MLRQTGAGSHFSAKMLGIFLTLILCRLTIQSVGLAESAPLNGSLSDTLHVKVNQSLDENHRPEFADDLRDSERHGDSEDLPPAEAFDQVSSTGGDEFSPGFVPPLGGDIRTDTSANQYVPQAIRNTIYEYDYEEEDEEDKGAEEPENPAPKYMVDLYNKFSTDRYSHPMANIIRSFENINEETSRGSTPYGNRTRVHTLRFNVTSVSREEEIYLAELRLYTLLEADRNRYYGLDRTVSIYEVVHDAALVEMGREHVYQMISMNHVYGRHSGWETFTITDAVKRWIKLGMPTQLLEVHIDTVEGDEEDVGLDINTRPNRLKGPLLVVFSNDKRRRNENRELHEMIAHEMALLEDNYDDDNSDVSYYDDEYEENDSEIKVFRRDLSRQLGEQDEMSRQRKNDKLALDNNNTATQFDRTKNNGTITANQRKQYIRQLYEQVLSMQNDNDEDETSIEDELISIYRKKRSKPKKKKKRNICKRKPMYVNFEDINWHSWIIAPKGYQAYECTGKCYFPLSDHLTPTKHAIIQTLLHTNYPNKASKACCVPTKLDPISILYVDEQGVVTYKYKYDGMKVADCGCR